MSYNCEKAAEYWGERIKTNDEISSVLSMGKPDYINKAYSKWELNCIFKSLAGLKSGRILDVACGVGRVAIEMANRGFFVTGVDVSQEMLEVCDKNVRAAGITNNLKLIRSDACKIPLEETYDVSICVGLLEHLPNQQRQHVVSELIRLTKTNGIILLVINNNNSFFLQQEKRYEMQEQQKNGYFCGLVNGANLLNIFCKDKFDIEVIGTNFFYSFFRHSLEMICSRYPFDNEDETFDRIFALASELDNMKFDKNYLDDRFVDHYFIKVTKKDIS